MNYSGKPAMAEWVFDFYTSGCQFRCPPKLFKHTVLYRLTCKEYKAVSCVELELDEHKKLKVKSEYPIPTSITDYSLIEIGQVFRPGIKLVIGDKTDAIF